LPISKERKQELIDQYGARMARAQVMIWSRYRSLRSSQMTTLRRQLQANKAEAVVVKNTLMQHALQGAHQPVDKEMMSGPCIVTFVYGEIPAAAKAVVDFSRVNGDLFQIVGGVVGGKLANGEQVRSLVSLPSREQVLAQLLGGLQAPISGLVGTLSAALRGIMTVLSERGKQLEGAG
jgi:large subunit ribosomal protein L10